MHEGQASSGNNGGARIALGQAVTVVERARLPDSRLGGVRSLSAAGDNPYAYHMHASGDPAGSVIRCKAHIYVP